MAYFGGNMNDCTKGTTMEKFEGRLAESRNKREVFSKININSAGGLRTYLCFTHSAFS